jgi:hypothetical protein
MADNPTVRLFAAILAQAVEDLLFPSTINPHETDKIRRDALAFLTSTRAHNLEDRETVCLAADLDPDAVRKQIVAILDGASFKRPHGRGSGTVKDAIFTRNLAAARALWVGKKPPVAPEPTPRSSPRWPQLVLDLLSGQPMTTTQIAEQLGTPDTTMIHSVCTRLVTQRKLSKTGPATFTAYIERNPRPRVEPESIEEIRARSERMLAEIEAQQAAA